MQKILVVEDDLDIQELLKNFLQEAGYSIVLANDGVEALSIFSDVQFDLILLDIMLPKIDGFAVCELIRKQSQVPIIMLTALYIVKTILEQHQAEYGIINTERGVLFTIQF